MLIVPTAAEGFSWTPVHTMAGPDTSATYYQDVRVPGHQPGRRGERRLETGHQPAQPRAGRAGLGAPIFLALSAGPRVGAEHQGRHGSRLIDSEWVQLNLARVHAKAEYLKLINWELASADATPPPPRRTPRPPRCSVPNWPPRPTAC